LPSSGASGFFARARYPEVASGAIDARRRGSHSVPKVYRRRARAPLALCERRREEGCQALKARFVDRSGRPSSRVVDSRVRCGRLEPAEPLTERPIRFPNVHRVALASQPIVSPAASQRLCRLGRAASYVPWGQRLEMRTALSGPRSAPGAPRGSLQDDLRDDWRTVRRPRRRAGGADRRQWRRRACGTVSDGV
jgi:hypothetical protein